MYSFQQKTKSAQTLSEASTGLQLANLLASVSFISISL